MSRPKVDYMTTSRANYKEFCKEYPDYAHISFETYKNIIFTLNSSYAHFVLEGEKVKLPQGFGPLAINKKKQTSRITIPTTGKEVICLAINWVESKKLGKRIYHLNTHTDGYRYKWFWFKSESFLPDQIVWMFNASRINSRKLAQYLKQENSPYVHLYREYSSNLR